MSVGVCSVTGRSKGKRQLQDHVSKIEERSMADVIPSENLENRLFHCASLQFSTPSLSPDRLSLLLETQRSLGMS